MLDKAISLFSKYPIDYGEFRQEREISTSISLRDAETSVSIGESNGISVRVLVKGSWGFASTDDLSRIEEIFKKAFKLAKISKGKSKVEEKPSFSGKFKTSVKTPFESISIEKKMADMHELQKMLDGKSVTSTSARYSDSACTDSFVSTAGSECEQISSRIYAAFTSVAKNNGLMQRASERIGLSAGYEAMDQCFSLAKECPNRALSLLSASTAPPGKHLVIIDGRMTGLLCHEALGHAC
ncbi:MAG: TldD/PmbA family protein, partial [Candidatus Micrarchaeota archaeon]